jgi:hypothetical protein
MKRLLSAVCVLSFVSTLVAAQDSPYWRPGPPPKASSRHKQPPPPPPPPLRRNYVCNSEWQPVCARTRQNIVSIYSNKCFAEQDGASVIGPKEECELLDCPAIYEPVCARVEEGVRPDRPGRPERGDRNREDRKFIIRPFYHECAARAKNAIPLTSWAEFRQRHSTHPEFSRRGTIDIEFVCPATCSGRLEVVCAEDESGKLRLYANRCQAILEGAIFKKYGVCSGG